MSFSPLPDTEAVCSRALRDAGICGGRVYSSIPKEPTYPLATVERLGGSPVVRQRLDAARIQVSVWGGKSTAKSELRDEAEHARRVLHEMEGQAFSDDAAYVTGVSDEVVLTWLPDPVTFFGRYVSSFIVNAHDFAVVGSGS